MVPWSGQGTCSNGLWSSLWIDAAMIAITIRRLGESPTRIDKVDEGFTEDRSRDGGVNILSSGLSQIDDSRKFSAAIGKDA